MRHLIGFSGRAKVGKDTAGQYLVENYGYNRIGLADAIKDAYYALNPWVIIEHNLAAKWELPNGSARAVQIHKVQTVVDKVGWEEAKEATEIREGLQRMGTEAGRDIHGEECWLNIAEKKLTGKDVITDIRFDNEALWVQKQGGMVVNISRNIEKVKDHASEVGLCSEYWSDYIINDGTKDQYYNSIENVIR